MFSARLEDSSILRRIVQSIKDLVKRVNIDVNNQGLSFQAMDNCHVALVSLQLRQKGFSFYSCPKPLTLGIMIENVGKILKIAGTDDSLTLQCQQQPSTLNFKFQSKRDKLSEFNLALLNLDSQSLSIPSIEFQSICTMPSSQFSRICKQFGQLSETITIQTFKDHIKFSIIGQIGTGSCILTQKNTGNDSQNVILKIDSPVSLSFGSRYLNLFSKASCISSQVSLYMSTSTPLLVKFQLLNFNGELKYYLAPKITQDTLQK